MTDIKTSLGGFRKIITQTGNIVFESKGHVLTTLGALTVYAEKRTPKKLYPKSLPYTYIGYLSISGSDVSRVPSDAIAHMKELIGDVPDDLLSDFVTATMREFDNLKESGLRSEIELGLERWMNPEAA